MWVTFAMIGTANAASLIFTQTITPESSDGDTTFEDDDNDFDETFDFTALDIGSIDRLELTLHSSGFADEGNPLGTNITEQIELWTVRAQGTDFGSAFDDAYALIDSSVQTFIYNGTETSLTAVGLTGGPDATVFERALTQQLFTFWLSEFSADSFIPNPSITVSSATLDVYGELAPIPLPGAAWLMLTGLAGFFGWRRRAKVKAAA